MRPDRPRIRARAVQLAAHRAGEDHARRGDAEESGVAEDLPYGDRPTLAADDVEHVPVLDPIADLLEPRARDRPLAARVEEDVLPVRADGVERVARVVRRHALRVERARYALERVPEHEHARVREGLGGAVARGPRNGAVG